ncbi:lipoate--protein ligase [Paenibacillus polymyxa]|uniref:lipoate--protein ligase n=1 Tax=Paenibacillus polymyxa TaxID=1406 RepID=UPI002AB34CFA|nr:lipoate--protein ligase [Paenibacillus polymyxa]MDY8094903.1 lipoate--protein ligase [Paenibacillus polymyxa]
MSRIYISQETDPYFNVALEYQLFSEAEEEVCLFLWQNEPAVIFGRNQNAFAECNLSYMRTAGIYPVRRFSGGGAVFQDMGNVNFTFITKDQCADTDVFMSVIQQAMASIGVNFTFSGRNDLLCQGKKFSGHAYFTDGEHYLYHGTIMVDVDLDKLTEALSPSILKLQSKGIASVRSRVINLSQVNSRITPDTVKAAMVAAFEHVYNVNSSVWHINRSTMEPRNWELLQNKKWIYGEAPAFSISEGKKLFFGNVTLSADTENGRILRLKVHTDSLLALDFTQFECERAGSLFELDELFDSIEKYVSLTEPIICYNEKVRDEGKDIENNC